MCFRHSFNDVTRINFRFRILVTWSSPHGREASSHIIFSKISLSSPKLLTFFRNSRWRPPPPSWIYSFCQSCQADTVVQELIDNSSDISVTITGIWTKFGTEHKYHTTNTQELPNSYKLKIQDGGGRHFEFWKNVNNFGLDILHQIIWEDAPRRRGDDHVTKSRNRKLIRVTSSN